MISDREEQVLSVIIDYYMTKGKTVGSRTLVKEYGLTVSSATVRNVMADLESMGYLSKTHTSSGRIPTSKSYKYYMKSLMEIQKLSKEEIKKVNLAYENKLIELEEVLAKTSSLLSKMTKYTGVVVEQDINIEKVKKIDVVHVNEYMIMVVLIIGNSTIRSKKIFLEEKIREDEIKNLSEQLNVVLKGKELNKVFVNLEEIVKKIRGENFKKTDIEIIDRQLECGLYLEGTANIIKCIDKNNTKEIEDVVKFLGGKKDARTLFEKIAKNNIYEEGKVNIVLGEELGINGLEELSFVFSVYGKGQSKGIIGVMGPKRMEYSKTAGLIQYVTGEVNKVVKNIKGNPFKKE